MKDFAVNGMNAIIGMADILAMVGLLSGIIFIVIDSILIMKAVTEKAFAALRLAVIAVLTSPFIVFPLLFTMYASYALKVNRQQRVKERKKEVIYDDNETGHKDSSDEDVKDSQYISLSDTKDEAFDEEVDDKEYIRFEDLKNMQ